MLMVGRKLILAIATSATLFACGMYSGHRISAARCMADKARSLSIWADEQRFNIAKIEELESRIIINSERTANELALLTKKIEREKLTTGDDSTDEPANNHSCPTLNDAFKRLHDAT